MSEDCSESSRNSYEGKKLCVMLIQVVLSRICATSKLMLGDLSRHINSSLGLFNSDVTQDRKRAYEKSSLRINHLEKCEVKTFCVNNLTQG